jgi:hypothetical protein
LKVKKDGYTLVMRKSAHSAPQVFAFHPRIRLVGGSRLQQVGNWQQTPPPTPANFAALIRKDSHKPWLEACAFAQVL